MSFQQNHRETLGGGHNWDGKNVIHFQLEEIVEEQAASTLLIWYI